MLGAAISMDISTEAIHTTEAIVTDAMTASVFARKSGERYPGVLATPFLIGEIERVSADALQPLLGEGQVSVGVSITMEHLAPTPVGARLQSFARFSGREGKLFWFEVWAEDPAGPVARGRHARAVVDLSAIESRAEKRGTFSK